MQPLTCIMRYRGRLVTMGRMEGLDLNTDHTQTPHSGHGLPSACRHGQGFTFYDSQVLVQELPWASQGYF